MSNNVTLKLIEAYSTVNENQKADLAKKLAKAAASSEKGKAAVTLPKAPWDKKEAMDPVDKKELKGKHADRDDKDIDNDGDADASDEYLHNRRKAVSKAMKGESLVARIKGKMSEKDDEISMNPKKDKREKNSDAGMAQESVVYARILEARKMKAAADKDGKHTKSATDQEEMGDKQASSKGAQDMMNTPKQVIDNPEASGDEVKKAADAGPKAATRKGDNQAGDKKIIPSATPAKGM